MKERLLFDRINIHRDYLAIDEAVKNAVPILAYSTDASLSLFNNAVVIAQEAPNFLLIELFIEHRFFHNSIIASSSLLSSLKNQAIVFFKTDTEPIPGLRLFLRAPRIYARYRLPRDITCSDSPLSPLLALTAPSAFYFPGAVFLKTILYNRAILLKGGMKYG